VLDKLGSTPASFEADRASPSSIISWDQASPLIFRPRPIECLNAKSFTTHHDRDGIPVTIRGETHAIFDDGIILGMKVTFRISRRAISWV